VAIAPLSLTVRFPSGTEYWLTEAMPKVGEAIVHRGTRYEVVTIELDRNGDSIVGVRATGAVPAARTRPSLARPPTSS
jgi:hypothetical protein